MNITNRISQFSRQHRSTNAISNEILDIIREDLKLKDNKVAEALINSVDEEDTKNGSNQPLDETTKLLSTTALNIILNIEGLGVYLSEDSENVIDDLTDLKLFDPIVEVMWVYACIAGTESKQAGFINNVFTAVQLMMNDSDEWDQLAWELIKKRIISESDRLDHSS